MKKIKKKISSVRKRDKKISVKEQLLHHLERKYAANLEPGPGESTAQERKNETLQQKR